MASDDPVVIGIGMTTAVGLSTNETAAAVRSAAMRFAETAMVDVAGTPIIVAEIPDAALPPLVAELSNGAGLTSREIRMLRLGTTPLIECLTGVPAGRAAPGLALALPEFPGDVPIDGARFLARLEQQTAGRFDAARSIVVGAGRAGGIAAIAHAADAIRAGTSTFMIAGAIDTYRDLAVLGALDEEKRVKTESNFDGFIPGEGAAFLLLGNDQGAASLGLRPFARLSRATLGVEAGHLYSEVPYRGDGLATVVTQFVQATGVTAPFTDVWSSMNGESHWAKEWSVSFLRNRSAFTEDHGIHHPADAVGDIGAAAGPLMVGLAAHGIRGGHRRAPALVYCSSDRGGRAAIALTSI